MSEPQASSSKAFAPILAVVSVIAIAFAVLWLRERQRKPIELVREVEKPVQVIREIPKEVVKEVEVIKEVEVPAKLTDEQKAAIDFQARFFAAQTVKSEDEVFYKVDAVSVTVFLNDALKKVLSENRLKNKFELILRQHGIRLDENASVWLSVAFEGLWDKDELLLTHQGSISFRELVTIGRKGDLRRVVATTWREGSYGYAGKNVVEKQIMDSIEAMAESFVNKFLASRDKEAERDAAK